MVEVGLRMADRNTDPEYIGMRLRDADLMEMQAVQGTHADPVAALRYGIEISYFPFVATIDGAPACVFGAVPEPHDPRFGCVWLMGTDAITKHPKTFLRHSKEYLEKVAEPFSLLWNCVDKRNDVHIRWLKWMGFTFVREIPSMGEQRLPFLEFAKVKDV